MPVTMLTSTRIFRSSTLATLASAVVAAPPAAAQEDGVFIDPDSPTAKQYGIPLESERAQADPSRNKSAEIVQGARVSPIFGAGIVSRPKAEPADSDSRSKESRSAGSDATKGDRSGRRRRESGDPERGSDAAQPRLRDGDAQILEAATSNPGAPAGGIGVPLTIGGIGIGVLLIGGVVGLLLVRRRA